MRLTGTIFLTFLLSSAALLCSGQSSVLRSGAWYKLAVENNGVYKLSYDHLNSMGFSAGSLDPRKIRIFGQKGGMLPQANQVPRPQDLVELSIFVAGESDGTFHKNDYILFYAEGPDKIEFKPEKNIFLYESNLYADKNYYFVTLSESEGKRLSEAVNLTEGSAAVVTTYNDFIYHERDEYNELKSGREWFGERFELTTEHTFPFNISGIVENSQMTLVTDVMAQAFSTSSFNVLFNGQQVGKQSILPVSNSRYSLKGYHNRDTLVFNAQTVAASAREEQRITYQYQKGASGRSIGFLDFFMLTYQRYLSLYGDQTTFRAVQSLAHPTAQYHITAVADQSMIWDISDPYNPLLQPFDLQAGNASFTTHSDVLKQFIVFNSKIPSPQLIGRINNQDLHSAATPNLLIVSHKEFLTEARRLAEHRSANDHWTTLIVTPEEIYNEFSSGRQDVTAIRDFVKFLYYKDTLALRALLLFGRCSYDYKDRVPGNTNFVPTYESYNSLAPLQTFSSDDYYGFLEDHEGAWTESTGVQNHTLDIGVGRLPVKSLAEARAVVDKIIQYDKDKRSFGRWRKDIVFVADDGNSEDDFSSAHQFQANTMAEEIELQNPAFDASKTFIGTYTKKVSPSGETIPKANQQIVDDFESGALIINYTGHGSERQWADENIFNSIDIAGLENKQYPFLVTATCEFGRHDDPAAVSGAEMSIIKEKGGSIGLVTTARPVNSISNFSLNQAFYEALFLKASGSYLTVGEVFRRTKNNSTSGVSNRNFALLADPSLTLAIPTLSIVVSEVKTASVSDTLKALSTAIVKGEIRNDNGELVHTFNGTVEATVFDKESEFVTIGRNDPPFAFKQWFNPLFRGKATVVDGVFEFDFIVPKNIAYEIGNGKVSLYATDHNKTVDAAGAYSEAKIGGSESHTRTDNTSPTIALFMGDTTFVPGGIVSPNTTLIARIYDESGVNISNYGIGNTMVAMLDDDAEAFVLNDHYMADPDDYARGWIHYPIKGLPPGKHTLTVKVWDVYNNPAQATIEFMVTSGNLLNIETFGNYPNPFSVKTTLFFRHNRPGDDLEAVMHIYSATGSEIRDYTFSLPESPYEVDLLELDATQDFGKKLPPVLYYARLMVRSLSNGSKTEEVAKLIIVN